MTHIDLYLAASLWCALLVSPAVAAVDPRVQCDGSKLKASAKYVLCRLGAEAQALKQGTVPDFGACDAALTGKWARIERRAAGSCSITGDVDQARHLASACTESLTTRSALAVHSTYLLGPRTSDPCENFCSGPNPFTGACACPPGTIREERPLVINAGDCGLQTGVVGLCLLGAPCTVTTTTISTGTTTTTVPDACPWVCCVGWDFNNVAGSCGAEEQANINFSAGEIAGQCELHGGTATLGRCPAPQCGAPAGCCTSVLGAGTCGVVHTGVFGDSGTPQGWQDTCAFFGGEYSSAPCP